MLLTKPIVLFTVILSGTIIFLLFFWPSSSYSHEQNPMARNFILWLHGLGDSGPANEPIKTLFTSPEFKLTKWSFPSAPNNPVTCNCKYLFIYFNFYHCGFFSHGFWFVLVIFLLVIWEIASGQVISEVERAVKVLFSFLDAK